MAAVKTGLLLFPEEVVDLILFFEDHLHWAQALTSTGFAAELFHTVRSVLMSSQCKGVNAPPHRKFVVEAGRPPRRGRHRQISPEVYVLPPQPRELDNESSLGAGKKYPDRFLVPANHHRHTGSMSPGSSRNAAPT